jgi:tetratricopeptide (TPR) repeat protein
LLSDVLGRRNEAIESWKAIERDFGEAEDAALALTGLLREAERWEDLAGLLERRAAATADDRVRSELLRRLGDVQRESMREGALAVATYAKSLAADATNAGARAGLIALAVDEPHRRRAVEALLAALRASDDWQAILDLTAHRLAAADGQAEELVVLLETAEIAERRAGNPALAFDAMRRAFAVAPGDANIGRELARLAEASGAWQGLVDAYREAIASVSRDDAELAAALRSKAAAVLESPLGDPRAALTTYLEVVRDVRDLAAGHAAVRLAGTLAQWDVAARVIVDLGVLGGEAVAALLDEYEGPAGTSSAWEEAARALSDAVAAAGLRGEVARDVEARLAVWHRDRRGDPAAAEDAFKRALLHDEANAALLAELANLQRGARQRPLVESLLRLSRATGGDLALLREAVEVACDPVGDSELARSILVELLGLARQRWVGDGAVGAVTVGEPSEPASHAEWAVETLARLLEEAGDSSAVVEVLVAGDALPFEASVRRSMRRRAARIALEKLGDHERAIELYLRLFEEDPHDEEAVERLAATYAAHSRPQALLDLRERQLQTTSDVAKRATLRLEVARLLVELGDLARAAEALRATLTEAQRHAETVEALAGVLDSQAHTQELRELLADQALRAEEAGDAGPAAGLWARAAAVAEARLGDVACAEMYHARVAALEERAESLDALARLTTARGDAAAAAGWLERLLEVVAPGDRVSTFVRLADALTNAGQWDRAAERLESELSEAPDAEPLRARLATLYREQGEWSRLANLLGQAAAHAPDKPTRMARLMEAATLLSERCSHPELAIPLLEQASDLAPEDASVRLRLVDALVHARRFDDARSILHAMIATFGARRPRERAPVHYQIARLELATGNRARALVELDTATRVDPQNPEILRTLAELARDDGQLDRAEKSYRALLVVLRRKEDAGEARGIARSEVLLELSAIAAQQNESDRAGEILESALEAASSNDFETERLEAALRTRGDDETLVRVLEAKQARLGDSPAGSAVLADLASVLAERLGRPEDALPVLLRAIAVDPRSAAAHDAALSLARALGAIDRYVDSTSALIDRAIEAADVPVACSLLVRLGGVVEEQLQDGARSAALLERAVDLGLRSPEVLRALDRAYERLGDAERQARVLAMRIEVDALDGGKSAACDAMYRLAALRLSTRATLEQGAEIMQTAMDLDPQLDRAEEALRRAVAIDPGHLRVLDLYEAVGRQPGHERTLVDALRLRAQLPGTQVDTVREAVGVAVRIGEPTLARTLLEGFVGGAEPESQNAADVAWALGALADLLEAAGDLRGAVDRKRAAAKMADPEVARRLQFEVARVAADRLDDAALAAETYETLHAGDPADREAWEPLAALYRRLGEWRKLATLLSEVVETVDGAAERGRLRLERVRVLKDGMGLSDAEAIPLLREIVDDDPGQVEAGLALASLLERSGEHDELAELLARQIESAKDRADASSVASLALRLGSLLGQSNRMEARNAFYMGLDWEPANRELLDALLALLDGDADAGERADLAERRLGVERSPVAEDMALALCAARLELGDEAGAERAVELGFRAHPASAALRERLERAFRARGDWRKLAELCQLDASVRADVGERVNRLREAADIWQTKLGDPRSAAAALGLAREAAPADVALLQDQVEMLVAAGNPAAAAGELDSAIDRLREDDRGRAPLFAARARLRAAADDHAGALADLERAFSLDEAQYAAPLVTQLERSAAHGATDAVAARALRLRQAHVLRRAGNSDTARALLADLVRQDVKDLEALRALADLEERSEHWDAASAVLRRLLPLEDGKRVVTTALRLADACDRAGRPGDARGALERARAAAPDDTAVRERLEALYESTGAWQELAGLALQGAETSGEVAERFAFLMRAGSVLLERAGEPGAALVPLEEAHALRPADPECVALLADALAMSGRAEEGGALLDQLIGPHKGRRTRELAPLYWRQAKVARYAGDTPAELRAMGLALDCDSQNGAVCADVGLRAIELDQLDLAYRALRAVTMLKSPGPMSRALAYQSMGEIARKQGDPRRALVLLKRALTEDPTLERALVLVDAMERGN